jgi:HEAT repeat protein
MPDFPIPDVFEPLGWIFLGLLAVNVLLFILLVVLREQWSLHERRRARIRARLAPIVERVVRGDDPQGAVEEVRPLLAAFGRQERAVAAWLLRDLTADADEGIRARVRDVLADSGAVELAERSTRRWMPWRRALACEMLGSIGTERSVPVLEERLDDLRGEVRMAAARALGAIGSPTAAPRLISIFLERRAVPTGVAYDALRALGPGGADGFRRGLESPDPTVRVASCFGIAANADEGGDASAARAALVQVLTEDDNDRVRTAAARGLGVVGGATPPGRLVEAARDSEVRVRRAAVAALASFDDPWTVEVVAEATEDADRETALRAAEALLALSRHTGAGVAARTALASSSAWSVDYARTVVELAA